jgi:hypothetical protein
MSWWLIKRGWMNASKENNEKVFTLAFKFFFNILPDDLSKTPK